MHQMYEWIVCSVPSLARPLSPQYPVSSLAAVQLWVFGATSHRQMPARSEISTMAGIRQGRDGHMWLPVPGARVPIRSKTQLKLTPHYGPPTMGNVN